MADETEIWRPGSFTKNFSWGRPSAGLSELHELIELGFDGKMEDVPREVFRQRVRPLGRPDYIPINFFLFNRQERGSDYLVADELVFQAVSWKHSASFDKLALFAFNLSLVGKWRKQQQGQRRPALWANAYIRERIAKTMNWDTRGISADDIQRFVESDRRYVAETSRKLSTNYNYLLQGGRVKEFATPKIERWWVDCLFLALDRIIEDRSIDKIATAPSQYPSLLASFGFIELTGRRSLEKDLAIKHLVALYNACGARHRFSDEATRQRTKTLLPDIHNFAANDPRPRGAVHVTNPRILKSIPAICAMLARYAGFDDIGPDELDEFDLEEFVRRKTREALEKLDEAGVIPNMSAEELMKLTRGE